MNPSYEHLDLEIDSGVATVWLARAPVNAINSAMFDEIQDAFATIVERYPDVAVVILASSVKHFSAGTDVNEFTVMTPESAVERNRRVREAFFAIYDCAVPVIAAVHGVALGTGVAMAGSADFVVAADTSQFGLPELSVGVMGGAKHLSRLVPESVVRWMFYTSQRVPAAEIQRYGGIIEVVPADELMATARRIAGQIAAQSLLAVRTAKMTLNEIEVMDLKTGYQYEQSQTARLSGLAESKETLAKTTERLRSDK